MLHIRQQEENFQFKTLNFKKNTAYIRRNIIQIQIQNANSVCSYTYCIHVMPVGSYKLYFKIIKEAVNSES